MPSQPIEIQTAETRFRQAFDRLKKDEPIVMERGTPVSQNNVAREASCDPSALKKKRFPVLVREIQAYVELHQEKPASNAQKLKTKRAANRSLQERLDDAICQRDQVQSLLASANERIIELFNEVQTLKQQLGDPPPLPLPFGLR